MRCGCEAARRPQGFRGPRGDLVALWAAAHLGDANEASVSLGLSVLSALPAALGFPSGWEAPRALLPAPGARKWALGLWIRTDQDRSLQEAVSAH